MNQEIDFVEILKSLQDAINSICTAIGNFAKAIIGYCHYLQRPPFKVINGYAFEFESAIDDINYKLGKIARQAKAVAAS